MAASACGSLMAAVRLANRSGKLVPTATNVMAVTDGSSPTKQPNIFAKSPMNAVRMPINNRETKNAGQPRPKEAGGTNAKRT